MDVAAVNDRLADIYGGSPWILVGEVSAGMGRVVERLRDWGVEDILAVAAAEGVGPQPDVEVVYTHAHGTTHMEGIRAFDRSLHDEAVSAALDRFDPDRRARVMAPIFGGEEAFDGRIVYGRRRKQWRELEDKIGIGPVLAAAGAELSPQAIAAVADAAEVSHQISGLRGTVWSADTRQGWHGGGEYTRWVPDARQAAAATDWFASRAHRVRIMPFLDGLPCSIHAYVTGSGVAVFRPVELLITRVPDPPSFSYNGMATTWDPPDTYREEMRSVARKLAEHLAEAVGYRGPFSLDGVATAEGFRPTEVNPRLSAGFGIQASTVPDLHIGLVTRAVIEGDLDLDPRELEDVIVSRADASRVVRVLVSAPGEAEPDEVTVSVRPDGVDIDVDGDGTVALGRGHSGNVAFLLHEIDAASAGWSAARVAVSTVEVVGRHWGLNVPVVEPAEDVVTPRGG